MLYFNKLVILLVFSLFYCCSNKKEEIIDFKIKVYNLSDSLQKKEFLEWEKNNVDYKTHDSISFRYDNFRKNALKNENTGEILGKPCFVDSKFEVYSSCRGEFGGAIYFKDILTSKFYAMECCCLKMIEKIKGEYFITESLAHMGGLCRVIRVQDPMKLVELGSNLDSISYFENHFLRNKYFNQNVDSLMLNQGEILFDSVGIDLVAFFQYKNRNFILYSSDSTYLAELKTKNRLKKDTILPFQTNDFFPFYHMNRIYSNNIQSGNFFNCQHYTRQDDNCISGSFFIKNDTIIFTYQPAKRN